jgi:GTPase SAR1 family protein
MSTKKATTIPEKIDTDDKQQLWHIIEKQRAVIYELQKALSEITKERDQLLEKLLDKCEQDSIPTPPPRSPFRSNMSDTSYTHIDLPPKAKTVNQQRKSMSDLRNEIHEKVKPQPGITKVIQVLLKCLNPNPFAT